MWEGTGATSWVDLDDASGVASYGSTLGRRADMLIERRNALKVMVGGVVTLTAGTAGASGPGRIAGVDFGFKFVWQDVLPQDCRNLIRALLKKASDAAGRLFNIDAEATVAIVGGSGASIAVTTRKHSAGHLIISSQMTHAGQRIDAANHYGTAPHHRHPAMQDHCNQIVGKAHGWLAARGY